jgi:hypothetical protein
MAILKIFISVFIGTAAPNCDPAAVADDYYDKTQ